MACGNDCVILLVAFQTRAFPPKVLGIQDLLGHDALVRVGAYRVILVSSVSACAQTCA